MTHDGTSDFQLSQIDIFDTAATSVKRCSGGGKKQTPSKRVICEAGDAGRNPEAHTNDPEAISSGESGVFAAVDAIADDASEASDCESHEHPSAAVEKSVGRSSVRVTPKKTAAKKTGAKRALHTKHADAGQESEPVATEADLAINKVCAEISKTLNDDGVSNASDSSFDNWNPVFGLPKETSPGKHVSEKHGGSGDGESDISAAGGTTSGHALTSTPRKSKSVVAAKKEGDHRTTKAKAFLRIDMKGKRLKKRNHVQKSVTKKVVYSKKKESSQNRQTNRNVCENGDDQDHSVSNIQFDCQVLIDKDMSLQFDSAATKKSVQCVSDDSDSGVTVAQTTVAGAKNQGLSFDEMWKKSGEHSSDESEASITTLLKKADTRKNRRSLDSVHKSVQLGSDESDSSVTTSPKKAATRKKHKSVQDSTDDESDASITTSTKKAATRKNRQSLDRKHKSVQDSSDESDTSITTSTKKSASRKNQRSLDGKHKSVQLSSDESDTSITTSTKKAATRKNRRSLDSNVSITTSAKKVAPRKNRRSSDGKHKTVQLSSDESDASVTTSTKKAAPRKNQRSLDRKHKSVQLSSDESDSSVTPSPKKVAPRKNQRSLDRKRKSVQLSSDESDSSVTASPKKVASHQNGKHKSVQDRDEESDASITTSTKKAGSRKNLNGKRKSVQDSTDESDATITTSKKRRSSSHCKHKALRCSSDESDVSRAISPKNGVGSKKRRASFAGTRTSPQYCSDESDSCIVVATKMAAASEKRHRRNGKRRKSTADRRNSDPAMVSVTTCSTYSRLLRM